MRLGRNLSAACITALLIQSAVPAVRAGGVDDYKLARAIPADVFFVVHGRSHQGQEWLNKQFEKVWQAVFDAHPERDIKRMVKGLAQQDDTFNEEEFENRWRQVSDLAAGVEWSTLAEREIAMCMKLEFPMPQFALMLSPPADKVKADFDGLSAILQAGADAAPTDLTLSKDDKPDVQIHKLGFTNAPFPGGVTLARHKDTLLVAIGTSMPEQIIAMLGGQGSGNLAGTPRFKQAFEKLPAGQDSVVFFDAERFFTQLRALLGQAAQMAGGGGGQRGAAAAAGGTGTSAEQQPGESGGAGGAPEGGPGGPELAFKIMGKVIDALDMFDYIAAVATTNGMRTTQESVTVLKANAKSSPLYPVFFGNPPVQDPLKFMPQAATEVGVWSGIDLTALYRAVKQFVTENVPEGAAHIAQFEQMQQEQGFNIEKDFLAWVQGGFGYFSVPGKSSFQGGDWMLSVTVKDEAKAKEQIDKLLDFVQTQGAQQNVQVTDAAIEGADGFKTVSHPMLAMMPGIGRPTLGVTQGRIMLSSGPKVVQLSLDVAKGSEPGFAKSERFAKEGIAPAGSVTGFSFTDTSRTADELGQVLQMLPMMKMMAPQAFANPVANAFIDLASKAGPVVRKLDFLLSTSSVSTFDGKVWATKGVTNYREPPPPAQEKPSDAAASPPSGQR